MIPLTPPAEPEVFDKRVRQPGNKWLEEHPGAKPSKYPDYWNRMREEVQEGFSCSCAYLGHWISSGHVDHFVAKNIDKTQAYEWSNYRYAVERVNVLKGTKAFLDPFKIQPGWIDIDPVTCQFFATDKLPAHLHDVAQTTLNILNDGELLQSRRDMLRRGRLDPGFFPLLAAALSRLGE